MLVEPSSSCNGRRECFIWNYSRKRGKCQSHGADKAIRLDHGCCIWTKRKSHAPWSTLALDFQCSLRTWFRSSKTKLVHTKHPLVNEVSTHTHTPNTLWWRGGRWRFQPSPAMGRYIIAKWKVTMSSSYFSSIRWISGLPWNIAFILASYHSKTMESNLLQPRIVDNHS
jgi:hypothetical protein